MVRTVFNSPGLQGGWFAYALGAANALPYVGPLVVLAWLARRFEGASAA